MEFDNAQLLALNSQPSFEKVAATLRRFSHQQRSDERHQTCGSSSVMNQNNYLQHHSQDSASLVMFDALRTEVGANTASQFQMSGHQMMQVTQQPPMNLLMESSYSDQRRDGNARQCSLGAMLSQVPQHERLPLSQCSLQSAIMATAKAKIEEEVRGRSLFEDRSEDE